MDIRQFKEKHIHFIGCGGIGMLGLALIAHEKGAFVTGSDIAAGKNTMILNELGIRTFIGHDKTFLPYLRDSKIDKEKCIVVYSSAVKQDNFELAEAIKDGVHSYRRGVFLAEIAKSFETIISVAGSHGKTTVTSMISHVLIKAGLDPGYYIGGIPAGWKRNASAGAGKILVAEADESDLSLVELDSSVGIALNLDNDHAWNVGGIDKLYDGFAKFAARSQKFLPGSPDFPEGFLERLKNNGVCFFNRISEGLPDLSDYSEFEIKNIITVLTVADYLGLNIMEAFKYLKEFPGVERRMTKIFSSDNLVVIEDYAHHPVEIKAVLSTLRKKYKDRTLTVIFQPHREKRLRYCFDGFIAELGKADFCYILPVFGAWEDINERLDVKLVEAIGGNKAVALGDDWQNCAGKILRQLPKKTLLVVMGAGDINKIAPLLSGGGSRLG